MTRGLTDSSVRSARPVDGRQIVVRDEKQPGLEIRVSPGGKKTWSLRYRTGLGAQRRLTLGSYPAVSLSQARDLARRTLGQVANGTDPAREKKTARAEAQSKKLSTVATLIESYLEDAARGRHRPNARPKRDGTMALERDCYSRLIMPALGRLTIQDLSRHDVQRLLDRVGEAAPSSARHCRNVIRQAYNYGIRREVVERNPAQLVDMPRPRQRDRVLTDKELQSIWKAASDPTKCPGLQLSPIMGLAICFAMVTLQRAGEVIGLHACELDRKRRIWTIPGKRSKNHQAHVVPLSDLAVGLLDRAYSMARSEGVQGEHAWSGYAFSSERKDGPMTRHALTRAVDRLTEHVGIVDARPHDFRRTGATNITGERIGLPRLVVSHVLNHMSDTGGAAAATGIYDRNDYLGEKRRALEAWARLVRDLN